MVEGEFEYGRPGGSFQIIMNKQHTEREWSTVYPHIVRLYLNEQRTLGEVMQIMETQYQFKATQSMYKKRIGRWQLHKYRRRRRPGTEQPGPTTTAAAAAAAAAVTTQIAPRSADVSIDRAVALLLSSMRRLTFMQRGPAEEAAAGAEAAAVGLARSGILAVSQLYVTFTLGSALFARGAGRLAGKAVRRAFLMLEDVVRGAHFGLDWMLLDLLYDFAVRRQHALYAALVAHLADVAAALLPRHHPIGLIAEQLRRYGPPGRGDNEPGSGRDVATMLQRAFFSKIDAVQSDAEVRAALAAQNRRVSRILIPGPAPAPKTDQDPEMDLIIRGIQATHYELERQKDDPPDREKKKKKMMMMKKKKPHPQLQPPQRQKPHQFQPEEQLSPPPPLSPSSSFPSTRSPSPHLPSPTPSFASTRSSRSTTTTTTTTTSSSGSSSSSSSSEGERDKKGDDDNDGNDDDDTLPLPRFIEARTLRSLRRMGAARPDALTLRIADRLFFSEYSPELRGIYRRKGAVSVLLLQQRRHGPAAATSAAAAAAQRDLLAAMRRETPLDIWGIIRELWALERILCDVTGEGDGEDGGDVAAELEAIRVEVDVRARGLLDEIPDDAP